DVESIPIVSRRMALRNVEGIKVVINGFDLRPALDPEAEIEEDVFNFTLHLRDGMQRPERAAVAGKSEVSRNFASYVTDNRRRRISNGGFVGHCGLRPQGHMLGQRSKFERGGFVPK